MTSAGRFNGAALSKARKDRAYSILRARGIREVEGFSVPAFLGSYEHLLAIEMSIVEPPFLLDFGGAYRPDEVPDFPENVWEEWHEQKREEFGDRWPIVENVLLVLRAIGIHMIDIHPRNLVFRGDSP